MDWRTPLVLCALLAGCGGGDDGLAVGERWYEAVASGDAPAACELMEPTAAEAVREKYTGLPPGTPCERSLAEYAGAIDRAKADAILEGGFEAGEKTPGGQLGIFPAVEPYDFEIILVKEVGGEWRVISVNLSPS